MTLFCHRELQGASIHDVRVKDIVFLIRLAIELHRFYITILRAFAIRSNSKSLAIRKTDFHLSQLWRTNAINAGSRIYGIKAHA